MWLQFQVYGIPGFLGLSRRTKEISVYSIGTSWQKGTKYFVIFKYLLAVKGSDLRSGSHHCGFVAHVCTGPEAY